MKLDNAIALLMNSIFSFAFEATSAVSFYQKSKRRMHMIKKHEIYKKDKWNMMTVEVQGRYIVLREISDQWGEETHTFMSRPALMQWADTRFPKEEYEDNMDEWRSIMAAFKGV